MGHHIGIVIGPDVHVGDFLYIMNDVTLGKKQVGLVGGMPKIGDYVMIGTGAKILGECSIGSYCKVGANSVVFHSFPDCKTIVGIPAYER